MRGEASWMIAGRRLVWGWRKVRTAQDTMLANGQALQAERLEATESGTENKPPGAGNSARQG